MSVFTTVTAEQLSHWLRDYPVGKLRELQGIAAGITNTNYFVTTDSGRYVLTLFEKNAAEDLPYFLDLMTHLAERGIPCPRPMRNRAAASLAMLNGKPASLVSCLPGRDIEQPTLVQCAEVGRAMAQMHVAGLSFPGRMENPRGSAWREATATSVLGVLDAEERRMLQDEMAYQTKLDTAGLPHGVIHADLFRDNVLFEGERLGGIIDFYYACNDILLYDVAIAVNDWCESGQGIEAARLQALLQAYHGVRPLSEAERMAWPGLLRRAALRFWLSRLYDLHNPQAGELTHAKDPQQFRRIMQLRVTHAQALADAWV